MPRPPVIGIGLPEPKARKHITPELTRAAQKAGIELIILDVGAPLEQQPHVDIILHKIRTPGMDHRVWGLGGAALEGVVSTLVLISQILMHDRMTISQIGRTSWRATRKRTLASRYLTRTDACAPSQIAARPWRGLAT